MELAIASRYLFTAKEYPKRYAAENIRRTTGIIFCILFFFLLLYRPFGVYEPELKFHYAFICLLHALSPSIILYAYFTALNYLVKRNFFNFRWNLFREYCLLSVVIFLIGIASFLMRDIIYDNPYNWSARYFWEEIRNCFLAGSLFYVVLAKFYTTTAQPTKASTPARLADQLSIVTQVKQDDFSFCPNDLLYARAEGNYVILTLLRNGIVTNELKRISLKQLELQIQGYPFFLRCHRAYLVNLKRIDNVTGNSQGYSLSFKQTEDIVPVARNRKSGFDDSYGEVVSTDRRNS